MPKNNIVISHNTGFIPMHFPELKSALDMGTFIPKGLPVYAAPIPEGVEIIIRSGYPVLVAYPHIILNQEFRNRFNSIFKFISKRKITVHAILSTNSKKAGKLKNLLLDADAKLPGDLKMILTLSVFENHYTEMKGKNCVDLTTSLFRIDDLFKSLYPNVETANFSLIEAENTLKEFIILHTLNNIRDNKVLVMHKDGNYKQGCPYIKDATAALINPRMSRNLKISFVNNSILGLPGETIEAVETIDFFDGKNGKIITFNAVHLPINVRKHIANCSNTLMGKSATVTTLSIPGEEDKVLSINKFFM